MDAENSPAYDKGEKQQISPIKNAKKRVQIVEDGMNETFNQQQFNQNENMRQHGDVSILFSGAGGEGIGSSHPHYQTSPSGANADQQNQQQYHSRQELINSYSNRKSSRQTISRGTIGNRASSLDPKQHRKDIGGVATKSTTARVAPSPSPSPGKKSKVNSI